MKIGDICYLYVYICIYNWRASETLIGLNNGNWRYIYI